MSAARCSRVAGGARVRNAKRLRTRYNLGPHSSVPVVKGLSPSGGAGAGAQAEGRLEVAVMRWGLVPAFAKRLEEYEGWGGPSTFNARVEGLESSGMWRRLLRGNRGVVLLDGFYEWKTVGKSKVPMFIRHPDNYPGHMIAQPKGACEVATGEVGEDSHAPAVPVLPTESTQASNDSQLDGPLHAPLMMAALYDTWRPGKEASGPEPPEPLESASILTMDSAGTPVFSVHDRMPVFLTPEAAATWMDSSVDFPQAINQAMQSATQIAGQLLMYEVPPLVSNMRNDSPECILSKKEYDSKQFSQGIGRFFAKKADAKPGGGGSAGASLGAKLAVAAPTRGGQEVTTQAPPQAIKHVPPSVVGHTPSAMDMLEEPNGVVSSPAAKRAKVEASRVVISLDDD